MRELISVIVPVFNVEKYLRKCVESIMEQSYSNFELILINDGSKDDSLNICRLFAKLDERIVVLDRPNGGAGAARNTGLEVAKGEYIVFVDSDDLVSPDYLRNLYLSAKQGNYDIVQCDFQITNSIDIHPKEVTYNEKDVTTITKVQALNQRQYKVSAPSKIFKKTIFEEFRFPEGIIYEDDASYYIFVDRAKKIGILNETLYYYNMSDNSVMRNNNFDKSIEFIGIYWDRINYFKERSNKELLDGSYDRFCLVLMLFFSGSLVKGNNINDRLEFINIFKECYPIVMKSKYVSLKDKLMFSCFNISPRLVGRIIGSMRG